MSTFAEVLTSRSRIPEQHVILKRDAFAEDWQGKPEVDFALGLRRVSDADIQTARAEAAKYAIEMHDDQLGRIESFNDALMRWIIIRGTCDANDSSLNAPIFEGSDENLRNALTSKAIRYLWDAVERFHIEHSPIVAEASDDEFLELIAYLKMPVILEKLSPGARKRFRKLVGFLLSELREVDPDYKEPDEEEPDDTEPEPDEG